MKAVLGVDTSCYTTSMAIVDVENSTILASSRELLRVKEGERGFKQSTGVFEHIRQLPEIAQRLFMRAPEAQIVAICASVCPRNTQENSYMPVFRVGESMARVLAASYRVPFYETSHQQGHIRAALVNSGIEAQEDFLALHLSGGTTEMLASRKGNLSIIGGSSDLHAGQLVDRIGVKLGLSFPCGPSLEKLALQGSSRNLIGVSMKGCFCQLSGAETKLLRLIDEQTYSPQDIAAEVYDVLCRSILRMIQAGMQETGMKKILLAGGVASSSHLRRLIQRRMEQRKLKFQVFFARPELSGDNAVGVALLGKEMYQQELLRQEEEK